MKRVLITVALLLVPVVAKAQSFPIPASVQWDNPGDQTGLDPNNIITSYNVIINGTTANITLANACPSLTAPCAFPFQITVATNTVSVESVNSWSISVPTTINFTAAPPKAPTGVKVVPVK